jgi:protein ImuA
MNLNIQLPARLDLPLIQRELITRVRHLRTAALPLGVPAIDAALPWDGLPRAALHEVAGPPDDRAAADFCVALLERLASFGPVVWIGSPRDPDVNDLAPLERGHISLLRIAARRRKEKLRALEEALQMPALAAVVAEIDTLDLVATRRLELAAEAHGVTALLLSRRIGRRETGARTRWHVLTEPGENGAMPRWQVTLDHCPGGTPATWIVERNGDAWLAQSHTPPLHLQ